MQLIEKTLKDKNLTHSDLSSELKNEIKDLGNMMGKYNDILEEIGEEEPTAQQEKELDEMEDDITKIELKICDEIRNIQPAQPAQPAEPAKAANGGKVDKEGGSGVGWFIFGTIALVVTLGAVNILKKKS